LKKTTSFYAERYQKIVSTLKKHGLWDLEYGLLFLPLIQHCMPSPSIKGIHGLLEDLIACEVDSDWAPLEKIKKLKRKVYQVMNNSNFIEEEAMLRLGINYPITHGIQKISNLKLHKVVPSLQQRNMIKRSMIITFVEVRYRKLKVQHNANQT
jgi:hypothetical protein